MRKLIAIVALLCGMVSADAAEPLRWCSTDGTMTVVHSEEGITWNGADADALGFDLGDALTEGGNPSDFSYTDNRGTWHFERCPFDRSSWCWKDTEDGVSLISGDRTIKLKYGGTNPAEFDPTANWVSADGKILTLSGEGELYWGDSGEEIAECGDTLTSRAHRQSQLRAPEPQKWCAADGTVITQTGATFVLNGSPVDVGYDEDEGVRQFFFVDGKFGKFFEHCKAASPDAAEPQKWCSDSYDKPAQLIISGTVERLIMGGIDVTGDARYWWPPETITPAKISYYSEGREYKDESVLVINDQRRVRDQGLISG
jgi:hypothetical protein